MTIFRGTFLDTPHSPFAGGSLRSEADVGLVVRDGVIHTPDPDCFLDGITRRTVIDIAKKRGFEVVQRHIPAEELSTFSEVFLCGTAAEVTPVSEIGPHRFKPGNISLSLMDDYAKFVRRELAPA